MSTAINQEAGHILPSTVTEIIDEIARFTDLPRPEIERRVRRAFDCPGANVREAAEQLGVTPHRFDDRMIRLYEQSDAYIFDSMVFWGRDERRSWSDCAVERIERYRGVRDLPARDVRVLAYGDGPGSDSLLLASRGYRVDYFDVPGSRTFAFALERFRRHGFLGNEIEVREHVEADGPGEPAAYDVVVCFEVLEHLTDPSAAIALIARALKAGGIALITEDFGNTGADFPTHLASNNRFAGRTPFMFLRQGLRLTWYRDDPLFKPMEYQKAEVRRLRDAVRLLATPPVARKLVVRQGRWLVGLQ